jgi:hypothetical protein
MPDIEIVAGQSGDNRVKPLTPAPTDLQSRPWKTPSKPEPFFRGQQIDDR